MNPNRVDALSLPPDTVQVTLVPLLWEMHCADAVGQPLGESLRFSSPEAFANASRLLLAVHEYGHGQHELDLTAMTGQNTSAIANAQRALGSLTAGAFTVQRQRGDVWQVNTGNLTVASREPTSREIEQVPPGMKERHYFIRGWIKARETDAEKRSLVTFDHALVRADGQEYYLQLDIPEALLFARTLEYIRDLHLEGSKKFLPPLQHLARGVWAQIPFAERKLYVDDEIDVYDYRNAGVEQAVQRILLRTNQMGVTEPLVQGHDRHSRSTTDIEVVFSEDSLSPGQKDNFSQLSLREAGSAVRRSAEGEQPFREIDMLEARQSMDLLLLGNRVPHKEAITMVGVTMDDRGKRALVALLASADYGMDFQEASSRLRRLARRSLGSGYSIAVVDQIISGNRHTGNQRYVRQVSGRGLLGATRRTSTRLIWEVIPPRS